MELTFYLAMGFLPASVITSMVNDRYDNQSQYGTVRSISQWQDDQFRGGGASVLELTPIWPVTPLTRGQRSGERVSPDPHRDGSSPPADQH